MIDYAERPTDAPLLTRRSSRGARLGRCIAAAAILAAAWSGLWLLGSRIARHEFQTWLAGESRSGRLWSCGRWRVAGFPFELKIDCSQAAFAGPAGGRRLSVSAEDASLSMAIWRPGVLRIDLTGPLKLQRSNGDQMTIVWRRLRASVRLAPKWRRNAAVAMKEVSVLISEKELGAPQTWAARSLSVDAAPNAVETDAQDVSAAVRQATGPALALWLNSAKPLDFSFTATIGRAAVLLSRPSIKSLEAWRAAGGTLSIERSEAVQDESDVEAAGRLGLDAKHRLTGELQTQGSGVSALLARFGAPQGVGAIASLADGLFGGAGGSASSLSLPLSMSGGRLSVGPFLTSVRLSPLY
jgi:hypothetical protein